MTLKLSIDGILYEGWIDAKVEASLGAFSPRFDLKYLDKWSQEREPWPIRRGDVGVIAWESQTLVEARVERTTMRVSEDSWSLQAQGLGLTGILVRASAIHKTGHWSGATALQIAQDLCKPFNIPVVSDAPGKPIARFALREGEKVLDAINRVCKVSGLLPITDRGQVRLYTIETALDAQIASGPVLPLQVENALERSYSDDGDDRYSDYLIRSTGLDTEEESFNKASAVDLEVETFCPLVVVGDVPASAAGAEQRAIWEANVRSARSERLDYVFHSPLNIQGMVYRPTQRYRVVDDAFGIDTVMMIHDFTLKVGESGIRCSLSMVRPEAYSQYAVAGKPRAKLVRASKRPKRTRRPKP